MHKKIVLLAALACISAAASTRGAKAVPINQAVKPVEVKRLLAEPPLGRALRPMALEAIIVNEGDNAVVVEPRLVLPNGVRIVSPNAGKSVRLAGGEAKKLVWTLQAGSALYGEVKLQLRDTKTAREYSQVAAATLPLRFLPAMPQRKLSYIPEPQPVQTEVLVGAHHCPLWEPDRPDLWTNVLKHPERTPALGFYAQNNPEVADWETKWAVEHGISFFTYCWYRTGQGGEIKTMFGSAIDDAFFKSRFAPKMKFTLMWENQDRGRAGVSDERDLMENLLPYWIKKHFSHPSYLKVDNKPVLFIYRPEFLIEDLGSIENVKIAFDKMRQACRDAGFDGLYLLGEYRGLDPKHLTLMKNLGLDYTFAYVWGIPNSPTPQKAVATQMDYITKTQALNILPQVVTVSQAWSGWNDENTIWKIPPVEFEGLLRQAKSFIGTLPKNELGSKMLMLDNWNEWGEGHYLAPYREYGFGYLDAVRRVFSNAPEAHTDLLPQDIGFGPYDKPFRAHLALQDTARQLASRKVFKAGAPADGLIGWWSFDEAKTSPVVLDVSGHKMGGALSNAQLGAGIDGGALVCRGGSVMIPNQPRLSAQNALTISCWVKTDVAGQVNNWIVNRISAGGEATGYRLGILEGKPCFGIPVTNWSHHLQADAPLPLNRWVHLTGTFDGQTMRIYVDGKESGSMARPGPIAPNDFPLILGSYAEKHSAHFSGLLDEVKLYNRALSSEEVRADHQKLAAKAKVEVASTR